MAVGSTSDWKKIDAPSAKERVPDWRQFEKRSTADRVRSQEREQEFQRRAAYEEYVRFENSQPQVRGKSPLSYEQWSRHLPVDVTDISLASQIATNSALLSQMRSEEIAQAEKERDEARQNVIAGKRDKGWTTPASAVGLKMSHDQAKKFVREQAQLFADSNPDFLPSKTNFNNLFEYLFDQGVSIPNEECLKLAWLRLQELGGLLEERPVPEPQPAPAPEPQQSDIPLNSDLLDGFDPETGSPRQFSQREVWKMDSATYRKAFRAWGDNAPRFTRGYYGQ